jgi:hypothetical protein
MGHKRKMREELLAHLSAIYQEELERLNDPIAALEASTRRFGDPTELSRELHTAVPIGEKIDWYIEHWLGWRAPESVVHMMLRTSFVSFVLIVAITGVPILAGILYQGWDWSQAVALHVFAALAILTPTAQFLIGLCYYKMRDSFWGVFGAHKSRVNATLWSLLAGLIVFTVGLGFVLMVEGRSAPASKVLPILSLIGLWTAIILPLLARVRGPIEIRDTIWATLDVSAVS